MKIGVLTHHWVPNFGANLQALATVSALKSMGHEVRIIDYRPIELLDYYESKVDQTQLDAHEIFINEFLPLSRRCTNLEEVSELNKLEDFDILVSGSDAVFRLDYSKNREDTTFPNPFWLTFAHQDQMKFFFSVSGMGTDFSKFDNDIKAGISSTLKNAEVHVRDKWTKSSLMKLDPALNIDQTLDPVFLLSNYFVIPDEYQYKKDEKYFLFNIYKNMVSDSWIKKFTDLANKDGYKVILLPNPQGNYFGNEIVNETIKLPIHPLSWYSMIQNSSGYLGVRFHPVVTSISNNVPFIAFDNYQKGYFNRFTSKTFDICYKTGNEKYCLDKIRRRLLSPSKALKWLTEERPDNEFVKNEVQRIEKIFNGFTS